MTQLKNKKTLITGGNSGIGFAIAELMVEKGADVCILGRSEDKLKEASKKLGGVEYILCDVSDYKNIEAIKKEIEDTDILVNAAGIIEYGELETISMERINQVINTNLTGLVAMTNAVIGEMKKKNSGNIVNISSTSGIFGRAKETVYGASKWGVKGFTEGLKQEVADTDIIIHGIYPGGVETDLFSKQEGENFVPSGNMMKPADIAKIVVFALEQPKSVKLDTLVINRNK